VHLLANPLSPNTLLTSAGLIGLAAVLFAETGLLIGFFLPGDTLLLGAGILISTGQIHTPLWEYLVVAPIAAILGNLVGYAIGWRAGPAVFTRPHSRLFQPQFVDRTARFFERYGWAAVFLARFVPIVRTVTTVMAGVGRMRLATYVTWTVLGGIVWTVGLLLLGDALGHVQWVRSHESWIDYVIVVAVIIGLVPTALHYWQSRRRPRPRTDRA
jgi:membrane-associated protein